VQAKKPSQKVPVPGFANNPPDNNNECPTEELAMTGRTVHLNDHNKKENGNVVTRWDFLVSRAFDPVS